MPVGVRPVVACRHLVSELVELDVVTRVGDGPPDEGFFLDVESVCLRVLAAPVQLFAILVASRTLKRHSFGLQRCLGRDYLDFFPALLHLL